MHDLAPEPTEKQFHELAQAVHPGSEVISTRRLTGGISCRMDVITLSAGFDETRNVVVRQYGPWHADDNPNPGIIEAAVLKFLGRHKIAVPALVLGDEATAIMGRPAIVTSLVAGRPNLRPQNLRNWAEQLVSAISSVHSAPVTPAIRSTVTSLYAGYDRSFSRSGPSERVAKHPLGTQL